MSQNEIYTILKNKRLSGDDRFFCQSQISKIILEGKINDVFIGSYNIDTVNRDLKRLHDFGMLEKNTIKGIKHYRLKKLLLEE